MAKFKRVASVLLAMVMLVAAIGAMSVSSGAASVFGSAKKMKELNTYSWETNKLSDETFYKLTVPAAGKVIFRYKEKTNIGMDFYDAKANKLSKTDIDRSWNDKEIEVSKKGTYYLSLWTAKQAIYGNKNHVKGFYYTFIPSETPTITMTINMKTGDKLDLSAAVTNYSDKVSWGISDKNVISLEKGTLTALKEGKAYVQASIEYDTIFVRLKINVTKKDK